MNCPLEGTLGVSKLRVKNKIIPYNPKLKEYARQLRKNSTLAEVLLWKNIKNKALGVQFHRQVPMLDCIVDFYCHELMIAIEIDGDSHEHRYFEDKARQNNLEDYGVQFIRSVSYTHLRAHETREDLVCRLLLEKKK